MVSVANAVHTGAKALMRSAKLTGSKRQRVSLATAPVEKFQVQRQNGQIVDNDKYEYEEQTMLLSFLREGDHVLQIGGNIGTSCIAAAKFPNKLAANICVEPSNGNLPTLKANIKRNNVEDGVHVLEGIVAEQCDGMTIPIENDPMKNDRPLNVYGTSQDVEKEQPVTCTSLNTLQKDYKFNVIAADCEGCFDSFLQTYHSVLTDLEVVIWERDHQQDNGAGLKIKNGEQPPKDDGVQDKTTALLESMGLKCSGSPRDFHTACVKPARRQ